MINLKQNDKNTLITCGNMNSLKENLDEAKIEEIEKAGSCRELNPGYLACAASALPLS